MSVDCGNQLAKTYVNTPVEEVVHLVAIDFHVGHGNPILLRAVLEKEVHNARNDARIGFSALDSVGLARRGHSVREYSDGLRNVKISFEWGHDGNRKLTSPSQAWSSSSCTSLSQMSSWDAVGPNTDWYLKRNDSTGLRGLTTEIEVGESITMPPSGCSDLMEGRSRTMVLILRLPDIEGWREEPLFATLSVGWLRLRPRRDAGKQNKERIQRS